jgi:hypothetical protein
MTLCKDIVHSVMCHGAVFGYFAQCDVLWLCAWLLNTVGCVMLLCVDVAVWCAMSYEVLRMVNIQITVFWDGMPYSLVEWYHCFGRRWKECVSLQHWYQTARLGSCMSHPVRQLSKYFVLYADLLYNDLHLWKVWCGLLQMAAGPVSNIAHIDFVFNYKPFCCRLWCWSWGMTHW